MLNKIKTAIKNPSRKSLNESSFQSDSDVPAYNTYQAEIKNGSPGIEENPSTSPPYPHDPQQPPSRASYIFGLWAFAQNLLKLTKTFLKVVKYGGVITFAILMIVSFVLGAKVNKNFHYASIGFFLLMVIILYLVYRANGVIANLDRVFSVVALEKVQRNEESGANRSAPVISSAPSAQERFHAKARFLLEGLGSDILDILAQFLFTFPLILIFFGIVALVLGLVLTPRSIVAIVLGAILFCFGSSVVIGACIPYCFIKSHIHRIIERCLGEYPRTETV